MDPRDAQSSRINGTSAAPTAALVANFAAIARAAATVLAQSIGELRRLNRAGMPGASAPRESRRERARAFKLELERRYRGHNRCC